MTAVKSRKKLTNLFPGKIVLQERRTLPLTRRSRKPIVRIRLLDAKLARDSILVGLLDEVLFDINNLLAVGAQGASSRHGVGRRLHRAAEYRLHCEDWLANKVG